MAITPWWWTPSAPGRQPPGSTASGTRTAPICTSSSATRARTTTRSKVTVTADDPKVYTKPFLLGTTVYKWIPEQDFEEQLVHSVGDGGLYEPDCRPAGARK